MNLYALSLTLLLSGGGPDDSLVLTNVNVVLLEGPQGSVLPDHAVIVEDGVVRWVGPEEACEVPEGVRVIDGADGFVVPGLTDAHVHIRHEDELLLNLVNGVTTVLNLSGDASHLELRGRVRSGELRGPTILTAGRTIDGSPPRNPIFQPLGDPEAAEALVVAQKEAGYDFIKVYDLIELDPYFALVEAADRHGMTIVGHIPKAFGLEPTLEGHRLIAHAEEYFYTFFEFEADESKLARAAALTAEAGVAVCPNIGFIHAILDQARDIEEVLARPEVRYVHPDSLRDWKPENNRYVGRSEEWIGQNEIMYPFLVKLTKALHDGGVLLLSGTDASIPGGVPGFALHAELAELTDAGLTPCEALRTVTLNPGLWIEEHLGRPRSGRVAVGHVADMLLLESNPLEDLGALRELRGVVLRGAWIEHSELRAGLEELARDYAR